jgi:hypothetical protein
MSSAPERTFVAILQRSRGKFKTDVESENDVSPEKHGAGASPRDVIRIQNAQARMLAAARRT